MKAGRIGKPNNQLPRRTRADSVDCTTFGLDDPTEQARPPAKAKSKTKSEERADARAGGLLASLLGDKNLGRADKIAIRQAYRKGLSIADLAALTVYELRRTQMLYEKLDRNGNPLLSTKDFLISLNKITSHVAAAAQLEQQAGPGGVAAVQVTFIGTGPTSTRPEAAQLSLRDESVGDIIDAE
jgi:hypothetical protein